MRTFIAAVVFMATANASYSEEKCDAYRRLFPDDIDDYSEKYTAACNPWDSGDFDLC